MNLRDLDSFDWCPVWVKWLLLVAAVLFALYLSAQAEALATDGQPSCTAVATPAALGAREGQAHFLPVTSSAGFGVINAGGRRGTAAGNLCRAAAPLASEASRV